MGGAYRWALPRTLKVLGIEFSGCVGHYSYICGVNGIVSGQIQLEISRSPRWTSYVFSSAGFTIWCVLDRTNMLYDGLGHLVPRLFIVKC